MIQSFRHAGIEPASSDFSRRDRKPVSSRAREAFAAATRQIRRSDRSGRYELAWLRLHPLKPPLQGHWAVWVDENWRLTFVFEGTDAVLVNCQDDH